MTTLTAAQVAAIDRSLKDHGTSRENVKRLAQLFNVTESDVTACLADGDRRVYESAERFAAQVNTAEADLTKASTADLAAAVAARMG